MRSGRKVIFLCKPRAPSLCKARWPLHTELFCHCFCQSFESEPTLCPGLCYAVGQGIKGRGKKRLNPLAFLNGFFKGLLMDVLKCLLRSESCFPCSLLSMQQTVQVQLWTTSYLPQAHLSPCSQTLQASSLGLRVCCFLCLPVLTYSIPCLSSPGRYCTFPSPDQVRSSSMCFNTRVNTTQICLDAGQVSQMGVTSPLWGPRSGGECGELESACLSRWMTTSQV